VVGKLINQPMASYIGTHQKNFKKSKKKPLLCREKGLD